MGITAFCHEVLGLNERLSYLIPLAIVFFFNFLTLRYFIFKATSKQMRGQLFQFAASSLAFRAVEFGLYWILVDVMSVYYLAAAALIKPASFVGKFLFYKALIFGTSNDAALVQTTPEHSPQH